MADEDEEEEVVTKTYQELQASEVGSEKNGVKDQTAENMLSNIMSMCLVQSTTTYGWTDEYGFRYGLI